MFLFIWVWRINYDRSMMEDDDLPIIKDLFPSFHVTLLFHVKELKIGLLF